MGDLPMCHQNNIENTIQGISKVDKKNCWLEIILIEVLDSLMICLILVRNVECKWIK